MPAPLPHERSERIRAGAAARRAVHDRAALLGLALLAAVQAADATVTYLLGAMVSILASRAPGPDDQSHRVRVALAPATPAELWPVFPGRFGVDIVDGHGMTETNAVIGPRDGEQRPGWMGRVMPGFEARVVDERDVPVPDGAAGELVMRAAEPYAFASGYWRMPEATVSAWRNLVPLRRSGGRG